MTKAAAANNQDEYNRLDVMFHKAIIDATKNRILITVYDRMTSLLLESFTKTGYAHGSPQRSLKEHRQMVDCIQSGDAERARSTMAVHLEHTMKTLRSHMSTLDT
jgi:DNA-binding FadR family transcriptional regulator